ncbi:beta-lactamase/transpeptidase-like protein [Bisporella sp. PMI_857]|nr:beta-lactamase/transpeptidase-like protein [Bisporella sp. PMI_857]
MTLVRIATVAPKYAVLRGGQRTAKFVAESIWYTVYIVRILHHGEVVFRHGEGLANIEDGLEPDADTLYLIASCSKAFASTMCAILESEDKISWNTPVSNYLPDFKTLHDPEVSRRATLKDLCSHATGLAPVDHAVMGFHDEYYNRGCNQVKISSNLPVAYDFRSRWLYNNCMYGVVGELIAKVCKTTTGTALKNKIFRPWEWTGPAPAQLSTRIATLPKDIDP